MRRMPIWITVAAIGMFGTTACSSPDTTAADTALVDAATNLDSSADSTPEDAADDLDVSSDAIARDADAADSPGTDGGTVDASLDVSVDAPSCSDGVQNGDETGVDCGGSCAACPPVFKDIEIGVRYHALEGAGTWFDGSFFRTYDEGTHRATAKQHMQAMVDSGVTVIHTTIWPAGGPPHSWGSGFPLAQHELDNLRSFTEDVRAIRSHKDGHNVRLYLSLLSGADSEFRFQEVNNVFPKQGGGSRNGEQFLQAWRDTISGIVGAVKDVTYGDGTPVMQRIYLGGEIMLHQNGSSPYDKGAGWVLQWFLKEMMPSFWNTCQAAGIEPSTYLFAWPIDPSKIMDGTWLDITRETMTWWGANLPNQIPKRIDVSVYTGDHNTGQHLIDQRKRILATATAMDALMKDMFGPGGYDYAFVEAHYYDVLKDHPDVRTAAFRTYRDMLTPGNLAYHKHFRGVHVWPYPYDVNGSGNIYGAAPPYDLTEMIP